MPIIDNIQGQDSAEGREQYATANHLPRAVDQIIVRINSDERFCGNRSLKKSARGLPEKMLIGFGGNKANIGQGGDDGLGNELRGVDYRHRRIGFQRQGLRDRGRGQGRLGEWWRPTAGEFKRVQLNPVRVGAGTIDVLAPMKNDSTGKRFAIAFIVDDFLYRDLHITIRFLRVRQKHPLARWLPALFIEDERKLATGRLADFSQFQVRVRVVRVR